MSEDQMLCKIAELEARIDDLLRQLTEKNNQLTQKNLRIEELEEYLAIMG